MKSIIVKKDIEVIERKIMRALKYIGEDVYISTRTIQDIFGVKKHSTVMERVRKELEIDEFGVHDNGRQIKESDYMFRGKKEKLYLLNSEAFMQVGMSIRTENAKLYRKVITKILHSAIRTLMKNKLTVEINKDMESWLPYRLGGKEHRLALTDSINKVVMATRLEEGKTGDGWAFKNYTNLVYASLGIEAPAKGVNTRDILTPKQLQEVSDKEDELCKLMENYYKEGMHYKEIYKTIKGIL